MAAVYEIPPDLRDRYTLNGRVPVISEYIDGFSDNIGRVYTQTALDTELERVSRASAGFSDIAHLTWLLEAFEKYPVIDERVLVIGSQTPLYEACCIKYGGYPITVELSQITCETDSLLCITAEKLEKSDHKYTRAVSISTHEHIGLGRYGDELDPEGDIKALAGLREKIVPGGLLYLAVPIGSDTLAWNAHRIYGKIRFPLLISGWELVDSFGSDCAKLFENDTIEWYQPVFVLRNPV